MQHLVFSQECYWRYHACHTSKYESFHESTKRQPGWVHSSWYHAFSIIFSLYLQGEREFTFPAAFYISLKHWTVCCWESWSGHCFFSVLRDSTLSYLSWRMRQGSRRVNPGWALPEGLQDVPVALWSVLEGKEQEPNNQETHVLDMALPLLRDLHLAEPHFPFCLKRMCLKILPTSLVWFHPAWLLCGTVVV